MNIPDFEKTFGNYIDAYNKKENPKEIKTENLNRMERAIHKILEDNNQPQTANNLKNFLQSKKIIIQSNDIELWNKISKDLEKSSTKSTLSIEDLPVKLILEIKDKIEKEKDIISFASTNKNLRDILFNPKMAVKLLDNLSSKIQPDKRFQLALLCGAELKKLDLSHSKIDSEQLMQLKEKCPNLESLDLTKAYFENLKFLPAKIKELNLSYCHHWEFNEEPKLNSFPLLESLNLSGTYIKHLDHLPKNLKELYLDACMNIDVDGFKKLQLFGNLKKLSLSYCDIRSLDSLPNTLTVINLHRCQQLPSTELNKLKEKFIKLIEINLSETNINNLSAIPVSIEKLVITYTNLMDEDIENFSSLKNLKYLDLSFNLFTKIPGLPPKLKVLKMICCEIKSEDVENLKSSFPNLKIEDVEA